VSAWRGGVTLNLRLFKLLYVMCTSLLFRLRVESPGRTVSFSRAVARVQLDSLFRILNYALFTLETLAVVSSYERHAEEHSFRAHDRLAASGRPARRCARQP